MLKRYQLKKLSNDMMIITTHLEYNLPIASMMRGTQLPNEQLKTGTLLASAPELYDSLRSLVEVVEILRDEIRMPVPRRCINTAYLKGVKALQVANGFI